MAIATTYCVHLNTELFSCAEVTCARCCCCGTLNTVEPLSVAAARSRVVSISAAIFFITNWWCLKYKNKEKPKKGPRPGPRLNYDVKIGPKPGPRDVKKSGPEMQGSNTHTYDTLLYTVQNSAFEQLIANTSTNNKTYLQSLIRKRQIVIAKSELTLFFRNSFCAQPALYSPRFTKRSSIKCVAQIWTFGLCCSVVNKY